jgi:hypothetical protein
MDVFDEDLLRFWKSLSEHHVRYIMVGGFATYFNGFERTTNDLDIWLEDTLSNRKNLRAAFNSLDYIDLTTVETMHFIPGWTTIHIGINIELDIMTNMKGLENVTFQESLDQASIADLNGIKIPFLHINQLILNKKAVNRPKDQIDVIELEKIKKIRDNDAPQ